MGIILTSIGTRGYWKPFLAISEFPKAKRKTFFVSC